jgi:hypothetical protein
MLEAFMLMRDINLQAISSLDALQIEGISLPHSRHERLQKINTILDLSRELQISALGGLIQFILKVRAQAYIRS